MPANEQTWRDTKLMHKIFGVTSALMLLATIWMFAADHDRQWKPIQIKANDVELTLADWRKLQFATEDNVRLKSELEAQLESARRQPIDRGVIEAFKAEVQSLPESSDYSFARNHSFANIDAQLDELLANAGEPAAEKIRRRILDELRGIVRHVRFREDSLLGDRKFTSANRDAAVAELGILVRDGATLAPDEALRLQDAKQARIDELKQELDNFTVQYDAAKEHRTHLESIVQQITRDEEAAAEALDKHGATVEQLEKLRKDRRSTFITWYGYLPLPGKKFLELPIFDAFNSPRKIDNMWSSGLDIDYVHARVRRFDRCTTCHQLSQKTMPGSAIDPAYEQESLADFRIVPAVEDAGAEGDFERRLDRLVGIKVAAEGLLQANDATIQFVRPESPAAMARATSLDEAGATDAGADLRRRLLTVDSPVAGVSVPPGLMVGDVIVALNGTPVMQSAKVASGVLDLALAGRPFVVTVRRGLPNPYSSHPRLDLYVGSLSPHSASDFACTICHDGQGSATAFQWASHTPNTLRQREDWVFNRGWFDNVHWMYPMYPERFAEATCLKCHHDVTELEPSPRFPDPPAPKVVHGYQLLLKYGCYGCHEIHGYDGPRRIGPDLRLEPNFFAAALQVKNDPGYAQLSAPEQDWLQQLIDHPDRDAVRRRLLEALYADAKRDTPNLSRETHDKIVPLFRDVESPGKLRKAGPSLRFAGHKLGAPFLYDWIQNPKRFRPTTRMPQFFGLWDHLHGSSGITDAEQLEPIEILGMATYLQQKSQPFEFLEPPPGVTEAPDGQRGRVQFETRGCLACHTHQAFPDTAAYRPAELIVQGPDLSGVGDKFSGDTGRKWLYSWIKEPTRYHARTVMPDLFLDSIEAAEGQVSDPAADIVEYLLSESKTGWQPGAGTLTSPADADAEHLDRFLVDNLSETFAVHRARKFAEKGIPDGLRGELKGAEVELLVSEDQHADPAFALTAQQKLLYLGRRSLAKYGCYGCHDVPGFEDAKPVGTTLADWGRKDPARLAFEHISLYVDHAHDAHPAATGGPETNPVARPGQASLAGVPPATAVGAAPAPASGHPDHGAAIPGMYESSAEDREYFIEQVKAGHRVGFIYQKLLEPRSFDYHKTENKRYNERLRMPQFPFTSHDREAVVTFVLGLVADPPTAKYIYQPDSHAQAVLAGRKVLEKYNCAGCHILSPETWRIAFPPDRFPEQPAEKTFPFVAAHFDPDTLVASAATDRAGLARATVRGVPTVDDRGVPMAFDDAGDPLDDGSPYAPDKLELPFELWQPATIGGHPYRVGVLPLNVLSGEVEQRYGADGGFLTRYLLPRVVALEKQVNPAAKGSEAWGWLPPPLMGEGRKVQPEWLHGFLLDPHPIRPEVFLRMPRFNMSPSEATDLVNYFAAVDGAEFPYAFESRQQAKHLAAAEAEYSRSLNGAQLEGETRTRLHDAMRVVATYCVKCHLVGDFNPDGSERAKAPDLASVYRRLRPEFLRTWVANPKSILPYTSMPVNIPYDPEAPNLGGIPQDLYHGTSIDQVDAVVDLLMNYDEFTKQRSSVTEFVKQHGGPPATPTPTEPAPAAAAGEQATGSP